uniref:Uncharacterized protein n=1 Tax=Laticauda laticaudata TaxID=8630 RepID=A0A8C5SAV4_LATLA
HLLPPPIFPTTVLFESDPALVFLYCCSPLGQKPQNRHILRVVVLIYLEYIRGGCHINQHSLLHFKQITIIGLANVLYALVRSVILPEKKLHRIRLATLNAFLAM